MLKNAYFLAKIGADTAENEQHFAEILPIGRRGCSGPLPEVLPRRTGQVLRTRQRPGGRRKVLLARVAPRRLPAAAPADLRKEAEVAKLAKIIKIIKSYQKWQGLTTKISKFC